MIWTVTITWQTGKTTTTTVSEEMREHYMKNLPWDIIHGFSLVR